MKSENQLFVELTSEESSQITGGVGSIISSAFSGSLITSALREALKRGLPHAIEVGRRLAQTYKVFMSIPGNGIIVADRKGTDQDGFRAGRISRDIPGNATIGVSILGRWKGI